MLCLVRVANPAYEAKQAELRCGGVGRVRMRSLARSVVLDVTQQLGS
jgi:hypothetical protein